jgi:hypothetical protein
MMSATIESGHSFKLLLRKHVTHRGAVVNRPDIFIRGGTLSATRAEAIAAG